MFKTRGYAVHDAHAPLVPFAFERRDPGPCDVQIDILYCGICHTDLHQVRNHWGSAMYPMVPGHEMVGRVARIGSEVTKLKVGDLAAVGNMVDSCRTCSACRVDLEQYCERGPTWTYNDKLKGTGEITFGGYAGQIVVDQHFVLKVPAGLDPKGVAPLLCAGITTYSPLRHWKVGPGDKVGIIGLGGLGHLGIKFAKALGAHVVMITTSPAKGRDATRLGANEVLVSTDAAAMSAQAQSFDLLLDTIPVSHDLNPYVSLLKLDRTLVLVGQITGLEPLIGANLMMKRRSIAGSANGGLAETQEMLDFCAEHGIVSDVEVVSMPLVNEAFERLARNDVKYRFVIDMATLGAA
jgi:uncharacterized zinc-type alcohol dehydrogenase-like protein